MISRRKLYWGLSRSSRRCSRQRSCMGRCHPRGSHNNIACHATATHSIEWTHLPTGCHPQWVDAAVAHEWRLERIPSGR